MMTVGYGDIAPYNNYETIFATLLIFLGGTIYPAAISIGGTLVVILLTFLFFSFHFFSLKTNQ